METGTFLKLVADHGLSAALLIGAVWWLHRQYMKMDALREAERSAFRDERDKRLALCEREIAECKEDRKLLHATVGDLQAEVRGLMRTMIEGKK